MGEGLEQRHRGVDDDDDDEELFDSDSNNSDYDDDADHATHGPLYELSTLMEQLPIKRGLSKYYQGKSQSYTSLSAVRCIEDLPKKESSYKRKMVKACESYEGVDGHALVGTCGKVPRVASLVIQSSNKKPPLAPAAQKTFMLDNIGSEVIGPVLRKFLIDHQGKSGSANGGTSKWSAFLDPLLIGGKILYNTS